MELTQKELKLALQSLYRFRGEVSGVSQSERNKLANVERLIAKIEEGIGPLKVTITSFDREIEKGLASSRSAAKTPPKKTPAAKPTKASTSSKTKKLG
jgi:hypothetical protein